MIPIKLTVKGRAGLSNERFREALAVAWVEAGRFWRERILPKHFTQGGAAEYRYQARSRKYEDRKARVMGHRDPMTWNGLLRKQVLRTVDLRATKGTGVSGKGSSVQIHLHGPGYLVSGRPAKPGHPNFHAELSQVSAADGREIAKVLDKALTAAMQKAANEREA